jgi:hypothetical protein
MYVLGHWVETGTPTTLGHTQEEANLRSRITCLAAVFAIERVGNLDQR